MLSSDTITCKIERENKYKGNNHKITDEIKKDICEQINIKPLILSKNIKENIVQKYNVSLSVNHVSRKHIKDDDEKYTHRIKKMTRKEAPFVKSDTNTFKK